MHDPEKSHRDDLEELDNQGRADLEAKLEEIVEVMGMITPVKKVLGQRAVNRWVERLEAKGFTATAARSIVELVPHFQRAIKLMKAQ
jgi:hypothetical protein